MLPIEAKKLEEIEHLLTQSARGIHLLFDNKTIKEVLRTPTEELDFFNFGNIAKIQQLLTEFIAQPSHSSKMKYLQNLDPKDYELLVRTYFHIVESTMFHTNPLRH